MGKKVIYLLAAVLVLGVILLITGAFGKEKTFHGRVIDADTKEPIEGAAVVIHWVEARATVAGESTRFKDVKEVLTDKDGKWSITGPEGSQGDDLTAYFTFFTGIHYTRKPDFIIFKPGYCSYPAGLSIEACKEIKFTGTGETIAGKTLELPKMQKIINREDRLKAMPAPVAGEGSIQKQKEFLRLLNEESRYLGIPEYK
jgi:hypothetical protein